MTFEKWFPNLWWNRPPIQFLHDVEEDFFQGNLLFEISISYMYILY